MYSAAMMPAGSTILKGDEEIKQGGRQKDETPQGKTLKRKEKKPENFQKFDLSRTRPTRRNTRP
jgi:hypothetical protein